MRGVSHGDDAGVFRVSDELALVQTVDVFTPVVDEPKDFGAIAAANSFSDCYAMGGRPISCLSIMVVPSEGFPEGVIEEVLAGANEICEEAGAPIIGGHSLKLPEPAFGLAVTGVVQPERLIRPDNARAGDKLILTKPIGTGIITTAGKRKCCPSDALNNAIRVMKALNRGASEAMKSLSRASATDVTGFGLLGHLWHILQASQVAVELYFSQVPILSSALELAEENAPRGTRMNLEFAQVFTDFGSLNIAQKLLLADAQTSGGLLISCPESEAEEFVLKLKQLDCLECAIIGSFVEMREPPVVVLS